MVGNVIYFRESFKCCWEDCVPHSFWWTVLWLPAKAIWSMVHFNSEILFLIFFLVWICLDSLDVDNTVVRDATFQRRVSTEITLRCVMHQVLPVLFCDQKYCSHVRGLPRLFTRTCFWSLLALQPGLLAGSHWLQKLPSFQILELGLMSKPDIVSPVRWDVGEAGEPPEPFTGGLVSVLSNHAQY